LFQLQFPSNNRLDAKGSAARSWRFARETMLETVRFVVIMVLLAQATAADNDAVSHQTGGRQENEPKQFQAEPIRTGKERLGRKSSDEQRVDNCNVPIELRGPKPRPDDCANGVNTRSKH
jgi:hypothetical protein